MIIRNPIALSGLSFRNPHFGKWNFELMIVYPDKPFGERQSGIPCSVSYCTWRSSVSLISHLSPLTALWPCFLRLALSVPPDQHFE